MITTRLKKKFFLIVSLKQITMHFLEFQRIQETPPTTSVSSIRFVLFAISCKLISHKQLSLIKIENCLGGVCLIQCS